MSLFKKILIAPALAIVFLLIYGLVSVSALKSSKSAIDDMADTRIDHLKLANNVSQSVLEAHSHVYRILTWASNYDEAKIIKEAKEISGRLEKVEGELKKWLTEPDLQEAEKRLGGELVTQIGKYKKQVAQSLDLATVDVNTAMTSMQTADGTFMELDRKADELVKVESDLGKAQQESANAGYQRTLMVAVVMLACAVAAAIVVAVFMARAIVTPLNEAVSVANRIADGDLTCAIGVHGNDETTRLSRALQTMQQSLTAMIGQVLVTSQSVAAAATAMSEASGQIAGRTEQQSVSISATAAAVEEMTVSITQVSENAEVARQQAEQTETVSREGVGQINKAAANISEIASVAQASTQQIRELEASSQKISTIANVIRDIAEQTNLLALNAAIEAARAGEQGRGFAVVADEVRKLAEKTGSATNEIKAMLDTVLGQTTSAVANMERVNAEVVDGVALIQDLTGPLGELYEGAARARANLVELSGAAREQTQASTQIAQSVERIAQMSEENAAAVQSSAASAQQLDELARGLMQTISRFRC